MQLVDFPMSEEVRASAMEIMPSLLRCIRKSKDGTPEMMLQLWNSVVPKLTSTITDELGEKDDADCEALSGAFTSIAECIKAMDMPCLKPEQMTQLVQWYIAVLQESDERRSKRASDAQGAWEQLTECPFFLPIFKFLKGKCSHFCVQGGSVFLVFLWFF